MKKLSIIIGGQGFAGKKYDGYLQSFAETVLKNVNGGVIEVKGFEDVHQLRGFEKEFILGLYGQGDSVYSRKSNEKNLTYTIQKQ